MKLRPELRAFARLCEQVLRDNDHKDGWEDEELEWLYDRLKEEVRELGRALRAYERRRDLMREAMDPTRSRRAAAAVKAVQREAADVANFAMMIADNLGR